jgi:hypothetical protein
MPHIFPRFIATSRTSHYAALFLAPMQGEGGSATTMEPLRLSHKGTECCTLWWHLKPIFQPRDASLHDFAITSSTEGCYVCSLTWMFVTWLHQYAHNILWRHQFLKLKSQDLWSILRWHVSQPYRSIVRGLYSRIIFPHRFWRRERCMRVCMWIESNL